MVKAVEARGIHHMANYSFALSNKGKKVFCARHSPGVGHAPDLARIPKRKLGRITFSQSKLLIILMKERFPSLRSTAVKSPLSSLRSKR
ncbi:beta-hydroxyisobutyryl-CoA hydrolase 1 [Prunus dulcis]|uniref:Beta-hydroxyisobutyryl-CoA hydrolase 1 n=1 Tax=Prunus dulcis TaxID=3755 RepID=A0A4Y1R4Y8_PRUDU|nr:beta-hydroxyisobutyryl-CoA hydrolase 1 [Prunus dulcis]